MSTYTPDSWVIVKIQSEKYGTLHKVLAGWSGSYLYGASWKMSSGIITFEDNSKGVPEKNKQRIFEYGFTTKVDEPGGEGLAYCMDILALSGASITETGAEGQGARFEILIPAEDIV